MSSVESGTLDKETPVYDLPVDSECKATKIKIFSLAAPHMRVFHLAWISFFMTFFATFAPAALLPLIRENLSMTQAQVGISGVTAVVGTVVGRLVMGIVLDAVGPRMSSAVMMMWFCVPVFCMSMVTSGAGFIAVRLFIGIALCQFVCCQYWVGSMFNVRIVGTANAIAAGWGNMGGGVTEIVMPALAAGIATGGVHNFSAWRWAFFIPGGIFVMMGILILVFGVDHALGDFRALKKNGILSTNKGSAWLNVKCALGNYRSWILALCYGFSFGVELTVDNIIVLYLYDQFGLSLVTAGGLGAMFGLMNLFSRASGGALSDLMATRFGIRGRLWVIFIIQLLSGAFCIAMSSLSLNLSGTIATMIIFSIFCQQACGANYGVVPFVSRRAYGGVAGLVGAGGNVGAIITQLAFFQGSEASPHFTVPAGLKWMGVTILIIPLSLLFIHFPMWGGMLFPGDPEVTEEDYYIQEWTAEEIAQGLHSTAMKFAMESKSQRPRSHLKKGRASDLSISLDPPSKPQAIAENVEVVQSSAVAQVAAEEAGSN